MKTNLVKKGSEKNIEMFQMSNEELATINGGFYQLQINPDGEYVLVWISKNSQAKTLLNFSRFID